MHRYKFYLDSGQDYRKMISLAESIDDLTNPAQIARLSAFILFCVGIQVLWAGAQGLLLGLVRAAA